MNELARRTIDVKELSVQERNALKDQLMQAEMEEMQNAIEKQDTRLQLAEEEIGNTKVAVENVKKEINVLGAPIHSKRKKNFKKICASRIWTLFNGDKSSCEYAVFSPFFFKKIYAEIANSFELDTYLDLNMENYELSDSKYSEAKNIAQFWCPSTWYVRECINDLIAKRDNGFLKPERCRALSEYLRITNSGEINPFC